MYNVCPVLSFFFFFFLSLINIVLSIFQLDAEWMLRPRLDSKNGKVVFFFFFFLRLAVSTSVFVCDLRLLKLISSRLNITVSFFIWIRSVEIAADLLLEIVYKLYERSVLFSSFRVRLWRRVVEEMEKDEEAEVDIFPKPHLRSWAYLLL